MAVKGSGKKYELHGESKTNREWCKIYGKQSALVDLRLKAGWDYEDALFMPKGSSNPKKGVAK